METNKPTIKSLGIQPEQKVGLSPMNTALSVGDPVGGASVPGGGGNTLGTGGAVTGGTRRKPQQGSGGSDGSQTVKNAEGRSKSLVIPTLTQPAFDLGLTFK